MSHKTRKAYTAEEKAAIRDSICLHQTPVSDLCDQYHLHPTNSTLAAPVFANGAAAFTTSRALLPPPWSSKSPSCKPS